MKKIKIEQRRIFEIHVPNKCVDDPDERKKLIEAVDHFNEYDNTNKLDSVYIFNNFHIVDSDVTMFDPEADDIEEPKDTTIIESMIEEEVDRLKMFNTFLNNL
jgi:hypothetical protein